MLKPESILTGFFSKEKGESKELDPKNLEKKNISTLKKTLEENKGKSKEKDIRKVLVKKLKKPIAEYKLGYDSFSQGLEPVYFWILDFLKDRFEFEVDKTKDDFEASVGGLFYGDIGTRASVMQDRAMKIMATVNTVVRSIINLIYDLREFDIRLAIYSDLKSKNKEEAKAAELNLRGLWMDQVDIKRGRGSINALAQNLQFVTLRDAFLFVEDIKSVDKLDLNERVKRIISQRLEEYLKWKEYSEKELRKRYDIEKAYLKSQVNSLKLYSQWAKPYFIAAQKLNMSNFDSANIVSVFNNLEIHLSMLARKKVDVEKEVDQGNLSENVRPSQNYYSCIEVDFVFRTIPQTIRQTQAATQFSQGGKVDVYFKAFALGEKDLELLKYEEMFEGLDMIEGMLDTSLDAMREDLDKYMKDEDYKKDSKVTATNPITALFAGFKEMAIPFKAFSGMLSFQSGTGDDQVKKVAESSAETYCWLVYDIYKKAHRMLSW